MKIPVSTDMSAWSPFFPIDGKSLASPECQRFRKSISAIIDELLVEVWDGWNDPEDCDRIESIDKVMEFLFEEGRSDITREDVETLIVHRVELFDYNMRRGVYDYPPPLH